MVYDFSSIFAQSAYPDNIAALGQGLAPGILSVKKLSTPGI